MSSISNGIALKATLIAVLIILIGVLAGLGYQAWHSEPASRPAPSTLPAPL